MKTWRRSARIAAFIGVAGCAGARNATPAAGAAPAASVDGTTRTLAQLFEGRPGVAVTEVAGGIKLRIRNAMNPDGSPADPLFVVNDLPIHPPNGVLSLNPADILRIDILKDDASTVIWGEKGANGVVKITMKRK
jgi:hypothetical protein